MIAVVIAEAVAIALLGLLVAGLLRSHAEILRRLHALGASGDPHGPVGPVDVEFGVQPGVTAPRASATPAYDVVGVTPFDEAAAIAVVGQPGRTLVAFLSSGCLTCGGFWRAFAGGRVTLPPATRLVIVTKSPAEESESAVRDLAPAGLPVVMSSAAWEDYGVPGSPYFVLVDGPSGRVVGEGAATGWQQVSELMMQALGDAAL